LGSKPTPILFEGGRTFTRAEKQVLCRFFFESHPWSLVWPNSGFWCCVFLTLWITPLDQVQAKILCPSFIPMHILFTMGRANKGKTGTCIHKSINIPKSISSKAPFPFYTCHLPKAYWHMQASSMSPFSKLLSRATSNCLWLRASPPVLSIFHSEK